MMRFQDLKIRTKLVLIMVLTGMGVLVLAMGAMVATEYSRTYNTTIGELHTLTEVVGWNSSAALAFQDKQAAEETLAPVGVKKSIMAAYLYDQQGNIFAAYITPKLASSNKGTFPYHLTPDQLKSPNMAKAISDTTINDRLHVVRQVKLRGETVGFIHIIDDQSQLRVLIKNMYLIAVLITGLALFLITILSSHLQKVFTTPVHRLITTMDEVADKKDYSLRVENLGHDEFGVLAQGFNKMLFEIQGRDSKLADHGQRMEQEVAKRTAQLKVAIEKQQETTREALEAKNIAEAASRAKSDFLATMSHEIRTPMNGVLGMAELLATTKLTTRQAHFSRTIQSSGNALLEVINDILDFSKIESGMLKIDEHDFHLGTLMEEIVDLMFEQANRKGLEVVLDMPTAARVGLRGDSHRLRQVLVNLIGNAIKFTSRGRILIRVEPQQGPAGRLAFKCKIIDTGIGISPAAQTRIFEAFTQADGSTTRRFGGTGLGLAISRRLIELMGGGMGIVSEEGAGSTFWFQLEMEITNPEAASATPSLNSLTGLNLLVVDDSSVNREILLEFAASWKMGCAGVASTDEALSVLRDGTSSGTKWDAVFLDQHLGSDSGIELAAMIRDIPGYENVPLIMLSSTQTEQEVAASRQSGVDCFLRKPVHKAEICNTLCRLLDIDGHASDSTVQKKADLPLPQYKGCILVAEDNPVNQDVVVNMLEILGLTVDVVENGQEAVAAVQEGNYDLIFMDCHMPVVDGFAATRSIRKGEQDVQENTTIPVPHIPIVALTANVQKDVRNQCSAAGMDDYLSKPFHWEQLLEILQKLLPEASIQEQTLADVSPSTPHVVHTESSTEDSVCILDTDTLFQLRALQRPGKPDIVQTAITKYFLNFDDKRQVVIASIRNRNPQDLVDATHFLKSGSANLGARALSGLCRKLESMGRNEDLHRAEAMLSEFIRTCELTRNALEEILEEPVHVTE